MREAPDYSPYLISIMVGIARAKEVKVFDDKWTVKGTLRHQPKVSDATVSLLTAIVEPVPPVGPVKLFSATHAYPDCRRLVGQEEFCADFNDSLWDAVLTLAEEVQKWIEHEGDAWLAEAAQ